MSLIAQTTRRVPEHTAKPVNSQILADTVAAIERYRHGGAEAISMRLSELDAEWDVERTLETNASCLALIGVVLGATVSAWWLLLPGAVTVFLLQHALQGWCPPLPVLRRFGFRTQTEIDYERYALKALRGDFAELPVATDRADPALAQHLLSVMQR